MAKGSLESKIARKKELWTHRTARLLHISEETTKYLLSIERKRSIRINPLAGTPQETLNALLKTGWKGLPIEWCQYGYTVEQGLDEIKNSTLVTEGKVYIQNAASWLPVISLQPEVGESVLDVCAAPGGKTSHIAALTDDSAYITANDNSRIRLAKLRSNMKRLNVENIDFTLYDATQLATKLNDRLFDKILLDAPCSGEGMMSLSNDKDFTTWSLAHIKRLQQLQKRLLTQSWKLLKPGGTLVYSTCTMAPEENEAVIDYLLRRNEDAHIEYKTIDLPNRVPAVLEWNGRHFDKRISAAVRLVPSPDIEAFFICKLTKLQ